MNKSWPARNSATRPSIPSARGVRCGRQPRRARMAKSADAADLKSADLNRSWGFKSPSGHHRINNLDSFMFFKWNGRLNPMAVLMAVCPSGVYGSLSGCSGRCFCGRGRDSINRRELVIWGKIRITGTQMPRSTFSANLRLTRRL